MLPQGRSPAIVAELSALFPGRVSTTPPDRAAYARDLWPRTTIGLQRGKVAPAPPDAIVWPTTVEEIAEIVARARTHGTPIVPFGAGSGVCGGALAIHGGLVVDLKRMRKLVTLDEVAGSATFEAGILGEHLEHELSRRGFTMGHFPSSIMCSTFGGWLAARSAGQLSTRYGKIEDMVRSLTFVDGRGQIHTLEAGATPDLAQLIVGSEGTLGIITSACATIWRKPEIQLLRGWSFARLSAGLEAARRLLQRGLRPSVLRLYDEFDSFMHRSEKRDHGHRRQNESGALDDALASLKKHLFKAALGQPRLLNQLADGFLRTVHPGCLLIVGCEGARPLAEAEAADCATELVHAGGRDLGPGPGERWLAHRYRVSFRMSEVFDAGAFVDTMEVATTWDRLLELYYAVKQALAPYAFVMAHFSHAYPDGCSIYFTFASVGDAKLSAEERYDRIWQVGMQAALEVGATISHHHGVGLLKSRFMADEHGGAMAIYRALKQTLDPDDILNPGKMGLPR